MANDKVEPFAEAGPQDGAPEDSVVEAAETLTVAAKFKKKRRSLRTAWTRKVAVSDEEAEAARRYTVRVPCEGGVSPAAKQAAREFQVGLSPSGQGQHTVSWSETLTLPYRVDGKPAELKPGSCNLMKYPRVQFDDVRKGKLMVPQPHALLVLEKVLLALLLDTVGNREGLYSERQDVVGARPQHCLILANQPASLELVMKAFTQRPQLITLAHVGQPFEGENSLHVLAVNSQEKILCEVVELAAKNLTAQQCKETFLSPATGVFFHDEPMCLYGSYPFSYAVAFSLDDVLIKMLECSRKYPAMEGLIDLNEPSYACPITGFLPLHVAVANSLTTMFNFLVDLPGLDITFDDCRANVTGLSIYGDMQKWALHNPLQLATRMGDQRLVQYILRTQSHCEWEWGPVSQWFLDLRGIDSCGDTGNDVMEICARLDAEPETREMLLDTFVDGIFHKLFAQKFDKFGRNVFLLMRSVDLLYLIALYTSAFYVKREPQWTLYPTDSMLDEAYPGNSSSFFKVTESPPSLTAFNLTYAPHVTLCLILPLLEEDLRSAFTWWMTSRRARAKTEEDKKTVTNLRNRTCVELADFKMLLAWMHSHQMLHRMFGWAFSATALVMLIQLRSKSSKDWDESMVTPQERLNMLLVPLACGITLHTMSFFRAALSPFERLGVFYNSCFKMLSSDVSIWLILFMIILLNYGVVMIVCYPSFDDLRSEIGAEEPVASFEGTYKALWALVQLAFLGEPIEFNFDLFESGDAFATEASWWTSMSFIFFIMAYLAYVVMSLILLLNLLIAMMGDTYGTTKENATLEWRVDFARRVLRLELQLQVFGEWGMVDLTCGERGADPDTGESINVFRYKDYKANAEGIGVRGKKPLFDVEIETEAAKHDDDDDGPGAGDEETKLSNHRVEAATDPGSSKNLLAKRRSSKDMGGTAAAPRPGCLKRDLTRCSMCASQVGGSAQSVQASGKHEITFNADSLAPEQSWKERAEQAYGDSPRGGPGAGGDAMRIDDLS